MNGQQHHELVRAHEALPTSPHRRQNAIQPPSLLTTTLGNAHFSSHGVGANPNTPLSTTSLSSPFSVHQASLYPASPGGSTRGTSPMALRSTTSFNPAYNPQQWGPLSSNGSPSSRPTVASTRQLSQGSRFAPRPVGPDEPVASPPPPYSPRRDGIQQHSPRPTADVTSPADTVSPGSDPSRYGTPVSAATTISPDFPPRQHNGRSPMPRSQPFFTESPSSASSTTYPPPPSTGTSTTSRVRSASKNHTDRLISSLTSRSKASTTGSRIIAIDTLQQSTAEAIANAPATLQDELVLRPPASRRAASTGAIGLSGASSRTTSRSPSQSGWEPGMPLPPPPPGPPPPSARSQSLSRPTVAGSAATDLGAPSISRTRLAPGNGTSLGPVPPTPADWREEEQSIQQTMWPNRSNGPLPLHIDTGSIVRKVQSAAGGDPLSVTGTPTNMHPLQMGHACRDSSNGTLFRSPAVRNRSAKGIRERRSESRNGKDRMVEPSSAAISRCSGQWANSAEDVRPTDLVLPSSGTISKRRTSTNQTPRSGKSIRSLDETLSSIEMQLESGSDRPYGPSGTTPRQASTRPNHHARVITSASSCDSDADIASYPILGPPESSRSDVAPLTDGVVSPRGLLKQRNASEKRPVSHLLHIPNSNDSMQAPLLPLSPQSQELQADLLGPESPNAFARRANDRHRRFAEREAAATDDSERLELFVEYILAESRIRRDQYAAVFEQEGIQVKNIVQGLFAQAKGSTAEAKSTASHENVQAAGSMSMHASTASESSAQGSLWHGGSGSGAGSKKYESPITASSENSPQTRPESSWWNDYVPCLSPIASMSVVTGQDEVESRGRAPSRWFEGSGQSSQGDAFRVLERSKRESKYMGVPREAREAPTTCEGDANMSSDIFYNRGDPTIQQRAYGADEYPPEKPGWHEETTATAPLAQPPTSPQSAPYLPDLRKLDISRLVTLPPPYPRHHPAVNNSHPDLAVERGVVRTLNDFSEPNAIREAFRGRMVEKRQRADSWCKHQRSLHEQDIQFKIEHGEMSQEDFDHAEADIESKVFQSEKETVQADFDLFQEMVVTPLHAIFAERISKATSSLDVLSRRLFSDAQQHSPNLPQEEGDEHAELLEKLTQLKWLFEARENLHSETYQLLNERNDKYKAAVLLPYQQSKSREKLAEVESFFAKDAHERKLAFAQAVASRCEAFLAVVENNVTRGVEIQLSAFWDIAPSLLNVLQKVPLHLGGFEVQIPPDELIENPSYHDHPLQYLYSLLSHAEKSTYQFIESQINLLCLLHEIRSLALAARFRVEESSAGGDEWASRMVAGKVEEEKALMDDLKDKVNLVLAIPQFQPSLDVPLDPAIETSITKAFTGLGVTQYPPTTTVQALSPGTLGTVVTALETQGHRSVQPFPTVSHPQPTIFVSNVSWSYALSWTANVTRLTSKTPSPSALNFSWATVTRSKAQNPTAILLPSQYPSSLRNTSWVTATASKTQNFTTATPKIFDRNWPAPAMDSTDIFKPIATGILPNQVYSRNDHPVPRLGIAPQSGPVSTNKFYANLFLGTQGQGVWTHPYSLAWSKGFGIAQSWGMAVSHIDADQRTYGPPNQLIPGNPVQYFINPIRIQSLILSAMELGSSTVLTTNNLQAFSVNAVLQPWAGSPSMIAYPLLQGMGFVTGLYTNLQPAIQSSVFFRTVVPVESARPGVYKWRITLEDGKFWLLYATPSNGLYPDFQLVSNTLLRGPPNWSGTIQVAKNPASSTGEFAYDRSAGVYPIAATVTGSVLGQVGSYTIAWAKAGLFPSTTGHVPKLLMFALPHHVASFHEATAVAKLSIKLQTTTKGVATAVLADSWTLVEPDLPIDMSFAPWTPTMRTPAKINSAALNIISQVAVAEMGQDMVAQTNLDSMYYSGKALSKFATLVYAIHDMAHMFDLAAEGLRQLKAAFARFVNNQQIHSLVYDTVWNGVVGEGTYKTGEQGLDFGNTMYNDHHFHYGYFIHTAAIIAYLDPTWLPGNKDWVNMLVRDAASPSTRDTYFPFSRMFDWYHGHSFAKGLFESADSKDEESSSEDALFAYAIKMWGNVTGDQSMEARGNVMLSILARTLQNYFLMESDNTNQPANYIGNKVAGILFENKLDHVTYFGNTTEYIQGIHMLPLLPYSSLTRTRRFISEEWSTFFSEAPNSPRPASAVQGGWKGVLYANLAIVDPWTAWKFFSQRTFDGSWIDGGASRTWYLVWCAGLGGATY